MHAPTLDEMRAAKARLNPYVVETPVLETHRGLAADIVGPGAVLGLKLEHLQVTGTFKAREALNTALNLEPQVLRRGLTGFSAGNHAIALAYAARELGTTAKVVMGETADPWRVERAMSYGAEVVLVPTADAAATCEKIAAEEGRALVHPFEGPRVAEASGGIALEIAEQYGAPDLVVVAVGGGGLAGGLSTAAKALWPGCMVVGVEPENADNLSRSLAAGRAIASAPRGTIADSLAPPFCLPYSFELCRRGLDQVVTVSDAELVAAMRLAFREWRLALEPAGAATLAALMGPVRERAMGRRTVAIVCGSTISPGRFFELIGPG